MNRRPERVALRTARTERGWSQADAARELRALARERDGPDATAASLKTQLSRWENGHAVPEAEYRALLGELYGRAPEELGLTDGPSSGGPTAPERLRARLAAAAAVDDDVVTLWAEQLGLARRLDDELGAAGAGELVRAQVEQLRRTLEHTFSPHRRAAVAAVLAGAADLGGRQALDQGDPEMAWHLHDTARTAAEVSGSPVALVRALAGQAEVLGAIGDGRAAVRLLGHDVPAQPAVARVRLAAARGTAYATAGDAAAAHREFDHATQALPRPDTAWPQAQLELADDLHRWHGHALTLLRDPAAVESLESALAATPRAVRDRAALHTDLALTLGTVGRQGEAAEHARAARRLAERIGSHHVTARLALLGRAENRSRRGSESG